MNDLKPCPFCGSTDVSSSRSTNFYVQCHGCGAFGPRPTMQSARRVESVRDLWNTRAEVVE